MAVLMKSWRFLPVFLLVTVSAGASDLGSKGAYTPVQAPSLQVLQDFEGRVRKLEDYTGKGKWLVVMIWASDCHVCNDEVGKYVNFHKVHKDKNATVLGISIDGSDRKAEAVDFIKRHSLNFPNLIGEPETVTELFAHLTGKYLLGTPAFLVFSPSGELRAQEIGAVPIELIEAFIEREGAQADSPKASPSSK